MTANEAAIRKAYQIAEDQDIAGWVTFPATGKRMDAPCCDVFQLRDGKIQSFNCYPSGTVIERQLGLIPESRTEHHAV